MMSKILTHLVPSSAGSAAGFVDSILTLVSSPHSTVVAAAFSFLHKTIEGSSSAIREGLVEADIVSKVLVTVQPQTLPISGNEKIIAPLVEIIANYVDLASLSSLVDLIITDAVDTFDHREMIFQKTVLPSSPLVTFLISNRILVRICPFHRPTLEFVLASQIVMAFSSCLSFFEDDLQASDLIPVIPALTSIDPSFTYFDGTTQMPDDLCLSMIFAVINQSLADWKKESSDVAQSGKRMMQALFSEGFEDTLEQILMNNQGGDYETGIECEMAVLTCVSIDATKPPPSNDSNSFLLTLIGCWECSDCWCRQTDSVIVSNRPEMVCSFGFVVLNAAVFDCHIVNRPLSKQFLAS
ncbi:hypothetical protein BLNAU_7283 [Blattamonas nauphoetae]|uniref:Uncharacterized protein n=1 Tax=Blattamonas nauphoetae TaxID=2049346 RepID=A0ABQ9Y2G7_9EUKA|nr:hypothetical protein BLNAU_7283 [Blattamonas nauphoetae]